MVSHDLVRLLWASLDCYAAYLWDIWHDNGKEWEEVKGLADNLQTFLQSPVNQTEALWLERHGEELREAVTKLQESPEDFDEILWSKLSVDPFVQRSYQSLEFFYLEFRRSFLAESLRAVRKDLAEYYPGESGLATSLDWLTRSVETALPLSPSELSELETRAEKVRDFLDYLVDEFAGDEDDDDNSEEPFLPITLWVPNDDDDELLDEEAEERAELTHDHSERLESDLEAFLDLYSLLDI